MAIRNITMNKTITTVLALVSILLFTAQAWSGGRISSYDYNVSTEVFCDYIEDPWPDVSSITRSYTDISGTGGSGAVKLPHFSENCVGDSSASVGGVAPPYVPPEGVVFAASVVTYYHNDALGSPVAATNGAGEVIWREEYRPYGTRLLKEDEGTNEDWFTGKPHEEEFGLSYFGARWYDPESGRFMGVDPVGVVPGIVLSYNRYIYANNNPYGYVDPNGKTPKLISGSPEPFSWRLDSGTAGSGAGGYGGYRGWSQASPSQMRSLRGGGGRIQSPKSQLEKNRAAGESYHKRALEEVKKKLTDVEKEVTVKTESGVKTRMDIMGRDANGNIVCIECKASSSAPLTKNQKSAFPEMKKGGGTVVGKGKPSFPGGTILPPTDVIILRGPAIMIP